MRKRAEEIAGADEAKIMASLSQEQIKHMLHELRVHQVELEMQNEELLRSQEVIEGLRQQYYDLYDFAPVGYVTLSEKGLILQSNLTVVAMLGVGKSNLVNKPLNRFIVPADRDSHYLHLRQLFNTGLPQMYELRMKKKDAVSLWVRVDATVAQDADGTRVCRAMLSDTSRSKVLELTLRESKERYQHLFESFTDIYFQTDASGLMTVVSPSIKSISGWTVEELLGRPSSSIYLNPNDRASLLTALQERGSVHDYKLLFKKKDGTSIPGSVNCNLLLDRQGNIAGIEGTIRDITERIRAEEYQQQFWMAVDQSAEGIAFTDMDGHPKFANSAWAKMHGYTPDELIGNHLSIFHTQEQLERDVMPFNEHAVKTGSSMGEVGHVRKDGTTFTTWMTSTVVRLSDQKASGFLAIARDISEQKHTGEMLQKSLATTQALMNIPTAAMLVFDTRHIILDLNETACRRINRKRAEIIGSYVWDLLPKETVTEHRRLMAERVLETGTQARFDDCCDGMWYDNILNPIFNTAGTVIAISIMALDITYRKKAEEEIITLKNELEKRVAERTDLLFKASTQLSYNQKGLEIMLQLFESRFSLKAASDFILEQAVCLTESTYGFLGFISDDGTECVLQSFSRDVMHTCGIATSTLHLPLENAGMWANAVRDQKPLIINDYSLQPNKKGYPPGHVNLKRIMVVPLLDNGKVVAVAALANNDNEYYEKDVIQLQLMLYGLNVYIAQGNANESLIKSEQRFRQLTESMTNYIFNVYFENGIAVETLHSPGCFTVTGYTTEEFEQNPCLWFDMVHEDDKDIVSHIQKDILNKKTISPIEHRIVKKDGTVRWIQNTLVPQFNDSGLLLSYDGLVLDITERKQAELKLKKSNADLQSSNLSLEAYMEQLKASEIEIKASEERYRTVADFNYDWEYWIGTDGKFIYISPSCERISGYKSCEFLENPGLFDSIIHPHHRALVLEHLHNPPLLSDLSSLDFRILKRDGTECWIANACQTVYSSDGTILGRRGSHRDITERKRLESEAIQEAHLASLGELAAGVAHEINNPIMAIINCTQLIVDEYKARGDDPDIAQRVLSEGYRVGKIVKNLLLFSRNESDETASPLDIRQLFEDSFTMFKALFKKSCVQVLLTFPGDLLLVMVTPQKLRQVIINVLSNALYALNQKNAEEYDDKILEISAVNSTINNRPFVRFIFNDHGIGMPETTLAKAGTAFFSTKPSGEGTGLGLSISQDIIKKLGGHMLFESMQGEWTKVIINLPAAPAP